MEQALALLETKMMFTKALGLAAAFTTLTSALPHAARDSSTPSISLPLPSPSSSGIPSGGVSIMNNLEHPVYMWVVGAGVDDKMHTLESKGGKYSESWQVPPGGGGVSIKMSTVPDQSNILQFEYTVADPLIFWDLSCIDMQSDSDFTKYGFAVKPSNPSGSCPKAVCQAGDVQCAAAYLFPTDDQATHGCPLETFLEMEIGQFAQ